MNIKKFIDFLFPDSRFAESLADRLLGLTSGESSDPVLDVLTEYYAPLWGSESSQIATRALREIMHNVELLKRLERALGGWLSFEDCTVLAYLIYLKSFLYAIPSPNLRLHQHLIRIQMYTMRYTQ